MQHPAVVEDEDVTDLQRHLGSGLTRQLVEQRPHLFDRGQVMGAQPIDAGAEATMLVKLVEVDPGEPAAVGRGGEQRDGAVEHREHGFGERLDRRARQTGDDVVDPAHQARAGISATCRRNLQDDDSRR